MTLDLEEWLDTRIDVSAPLRAALDVSGLGGRPQRFQVLDRLCRALGRDTHPLRQEAYWLLDDMLTALEDYFKAGDTGSFIEDAANDWHNRIARQAVSRLSTDQVTAAFRQLKVRCQIDTPGNRVDLFELADLVKQTAAGRLSSQILRLLEKWRKSGKRQYRGEQRPGRPRLTFAP